MRIRVAVTAAILVAMPGCATRIAPVEVTRFHLDQPIAPGTIRVAPIEHNRMGLEAQTYVAAVERELARLGFTPVADVASAQYAAVIDLRQGFRPAGQSRPPVTIGLGGGTGGYGGGVGAGVGFGIGGGGGGDIAVSDLSVRMTRRALEEVVWEGRARAESRARAPAAQPGLAADKLTRALFAGFPGESGRTISVP